jgi:hypothetical protein
VVNNPYVKQGWKFIDQTVGNNIRNRVSPYQNNNAVKTLALGQQNVRSRGPPKIPAAQLPTCSQLQGRTTKQVVGQHILGGGRELVETVARYNPALGGVPRMLNGIEVMVNATSRKDPRVAGAAVKEYGQGQVEAAVKGVANAMAEGRDPTEDFNLGQHITNEITGGE